MRGSKNPIAKAMFESKLYREKGVGNPYFEPYNRRGESDDIEAGLRENDECPTCGRNYNYCYCNEA